MADIGKDMQKAYDDGYHEGYQMGKLDAVGHGRWMGTVCSACGGSTSYYYDCDYCPHCGAKMDLEEAQ